MNKKVIFFIFFCGLLKQSSLLLSSDKPKQRPPIPAPSPRMQEYAQEQMRIKKEEEQKQEQQQSSFDRLLRQAESSSPKKTEAPAPDYSNFEAKSQELIATIPTYEQISTENFSDMVKDLKSSQIALVSSQQQTFREQQERKKLLEEKIKSENETRRILENKQINASATPVLNIPEQPQHSTKLDQDASKITLESSYSRIFVLSSLIAASIITIGTVVYLWQDRLLELLKIVNEYFQPPLATLTTDK